MISATLGDAFGQERVMRDSSELLRQAGHEVFFLADWRMGNLPACEGHRFVPGIAGVGTLSSALKVKALGNEIAAYLKSIRPDVVHFIDQFDFRLMDRVVSEYPTVLTAHTVSPTCPAGTRHIKTDVPTCGKKSGLACLVHQRELGCLDGFRGLLRKAHVVQTYLLRRRVMKRIPIAIAISRYVESVLRHDGWDGDRIRVVHNPVNPVPAPLSVPIPENLFVVAARLVPLKGIEYALQALSRLQHRPWTLWICGEGPYRPQLEHWVRELGLTGRVEFKGRVPAENLFAYLQSTRALLQPNVGPEGFGLSVAEALALGAPAITFDVPALNEIVEHERTGLLVKAKDVTGLQKAIEKILDNDIHRVLRENALRSKSRYSPEAHLSGTLASYRDAISIFLKRGAAEIPVDVRLLDGVANRGETETT